MSCPAGNPKHTTDIQTREGEDRRGGTMKNQKSSKTTTSSKGNQANNKKANGTNVTKPEPKPSVQCASLTADGNRCRQSAMEGKLYCTDHRPAIDHLTAAEKKALKQAVKQWSDPAAEVVALIGWWKAREIARRTLAPSAPAVTSRSVTASTTGESAAIQ